MMQILSFEQIIDRLRKLELPSVDCVVGVGRGGVLPAALSAFALNCPLRIVAVNYRDDSNTPCRSRPEIFSDIALPEGIRSILVVDDVAVTGKTLQAVKSRIQAETITTFVFKGKADFVLFPEIEGCVQWPWNVLKGAFKD